MVLGLFEGSIDIVVDNQFYSPSQTISGKVILNLKAPKKAKKLRIQFYGERKVRRNMGRNDTTERILVQEIVLSGEQEYPAGTVVYPFELKLPSLEKPKAPFAGNNFFEKFINALATVDPYSNVKWYLDASLDLPLSFDINKRKLINLVR
jgi:hypothetical protein